MATPDDAEQLWTQWDPRVLGRFEGEWIAFQKGEVRYHSQSLSEVMNRFADEIKKGSAPLFAFVTFGPRL
jgi:hypothetical protein